MAIFLRCYLPTTADQVEVGVPALLPGYRAALPFDLFVIHPFFFSLSPLSFLLRYLQSLLFFLYTTTTTFIKAIGSVGIKKGGRKIGGSCLFRRFTQVTHVFTSRQGQVWEAGHKKATGGDLDDRGHVCWEILLAPSFFSPFLFLSFSFFFLRYIGGGAESREGTHTTPFTLGESVNGGRNGGIYAE